jgi:FkbM family methyltransferase
MNFGILSRVVGRLAPRTLWRYRIAAWGLTTGEAEQSLIPGLCRQDLLSIDVGAANGAYTAHLLLHSRGVVAFEPRPDAAEKLRAMFAGTSPVRIEDAALSDTIGTVEFRVPDGRPLLSTIESTNQLVDAPPHRVTRIETKRMDDYEFRAVGFIKIDVEGHELSVLRGARRTIERERPNVMVEVEERHCPGGLAAITQFFAALGWSGFFLMDGRLRRIEEFDETQLQRASNIDDAGHRAGIYINNFIFKPDDAGRTSNGDRSA